MLTGPMNRSHITYAPCPEATPEAQLATLANVYRFVLDRHGKKEATRPGSPDATKEIKNDSRPKHHNR